MLQRVLRPTVHVWRRTNWRSGKQAALGIGAATAATGITAATAAVGWEPVVSRETLTGTVQVAEHHGLIWDTFEVEIAMAGLRRTSVATKDGDTIPSLQLNLRRASVDRRMDKTERQRLEEALMRSLTANRPVDIKCERTLIALPWNSRTRTLVKDVSSPK